MYLVVEFEDGFQSAGGISIGAKGRIEVGRHMFGWLECGRHEHCLHVVLAQLFCGYDAFDVGSHRELFADAQVLVYMP